MKFSYLWLKDYLAKNVSAETLAGLLTMHSFQVESVEKKGDDCILDVDVLPNRAHDCFSHLGISREAAVVTRSVLKMPPGASRKVAFREDKERIGKYLKIRVKDPEGTPRYSLRMMKGVKVGPSPAWLQKRLLAVGQKPINNIVDIANFVMLELGQPLHAFDYDKLYGRTAGGKTIMVRRARKGEKMTSLDNVEYELGEKILVIADEQNPTAIAGIKGGLGPGIDERTNVIVLEGANFDPQTIRTGSRLLNLKTDASIRFEQGIDPNLTEVALNRACYLIWKCAGGKVLSGLLDFYPKKVLPRKIRIRLAQINRLAGIGFGAAEVIKILKMLNFKARLISAKNAELLVEVPTERIDVELPEDLIEEICRVYGYEKIPARVPNAALVPPKRDELVDFSNKLREILEGLGFFEAYNYSFVSGEDIDGLGIGKQSAVELENPLSQDLEYLRPALFAGLLKNVRENLKNFDAIKLYEIGKVFRGGTSGPAETWHFSGIAARREKEGIPGELFYEVKGVLDAVLGEFGIDDPWYDDVEPSPGDALYFWDLSRAAQILIRDEKLGFLGEIDRRVLARFDIKNRAVAFDFDLKKLFDRVEEEWEYSPIPQYPAATRDIAILVDRRIKVEQVLNVIYSAGRQYLQDVDLFDIYEGLQLEAEKKSLAFHLIFQAVDHTLTEAEIKDEMGKIVKALREEIGAAIRGSAGQS